MNLYNYTRFKKNLGAALYETAFDNVVEIETLHSLVFDFENCNGNNKELQQYLNILWMYDNLAVKNLLLNNTLLITIDSTTKELAWILRLNNIKNFEDVICDFSENLI